CPGSAAHPAAHGQPPARSCRPLRWPCPACSTSSFSPDRHPGRCTVAVIATAAPLQRPYCHVWTCELRTTNCECNCVVTPARPMPVPSPCRTAAPMPPEDEPLFNTHLTKSSMQPNIAVTKNAAKTRGVMTGLSVLAGNLP